MRLGPCLVGLLATAAALAQAFAVSAAESVATELALRLDSESRRLEAAATLTVTGGGPALLSLGESFRVSRLTVDGIDQSVPARRGARLEIALGEPGRHQVKLDYAGVLAPATGPDQGPLGPQEAVAGADGSFLPPGDWWPALDGAAGDFRLSIRVPAGQVATATGRRVSERHDGNGYAVTFEGGARQQPPAVFAGPYAIAERIAHGVTIRTYFHDQVAPLAGDYLDAAVQAIGRFEGRIGRYPFDGFDIVSAPFPVGLGFAGATYVSRQILPLPFMRGRSLVHEILHNWWGNGVRVDYSSGNWSEGLTTYMADYALAEDEGEASARDMRLSWLRDFAALPPGRDIPLTQFAARRHGAAQVIGYDKAAMIFHMLRDEIGRASFDAGVRRLWKAQAGRRARWGDIESAFEAASGRDLGRFFGQWLARAGAPELSLDRADVARDDGDWLVTVALSQGDPAYRLTVPVAVETESGPMRFPMPLDEGGTIATLRLPARPCWLAVDPDYQLFRRLAPGEAPPILRDVTLDASSPLVVAGKDPEVYRPARALAARLLEVEEVRVAAPESGWPEATMLVIGLTPDVYGLLAAHDLGVPAAIRDRGSARAWVMPRAAAGPLLAVAADDSATLEAVIRPLPHYGSWSYVVFDGAHIIDRGLWEGKVEHALRRRLDCR